ncbi:enoyl-CoA hydratase/isomerase family protein [Pendulispora albinea]|uniref:Enoyl-CoA hydratase-related protein n=1 Tax=Pendulispora albinea TaxID=2741071 RepID=A0ABZ2LM40_9BACT
MSSAVLLERVGRTSVITINRPEARNALTRDVIHGVRDAFFAANRDSETRCLVLRGQGQHFCAGADLRKNLMDDPNLMDHLEMYMDEYHSLIKAIVECEKPSIAALDGCAVGFGADLALVCDLRVATPEAYVQEKFVKIGLMPDGGGTFFLPRLVGTARAMQMILLADKVMGPELLSLGVVARLVPSPELLASALLVAQQIEQGPPLAYREIRRALYASLGSIEDALRREREGQLKLLRSADCMEGIMSFMQKREPVFQGK